MPKSSLLMLVSAFIGFDNMKHIYKTKTNKNISIIETFLFLQQIIFQSYKETRLEITMYI